MDRPVSDVIEAFFRQHDLNVNRISVGLSGGPDSMALTKLLSDFSKTNNDIEIHALIVDHGLRDESAREAEQTKERVKGWANVAPKILTCDFDASASVMERARMARYEQFKIYCHDHEIEHIFLGHHQEDQAETFLFRLAKGSGLDGLAAMSPMQRIDTALCLMRPLLDVSKEALVELCKRQDIQFIEDPSNEKEDFARVRIRKSADILAQEGLSPKRLTVTAKRIARAKNTLESLADTNFHNMLLESDADRIVFYNSIFIESLDEIAFRGILKAVKSLRLEENYLPRMEKLEDLFEALRDENQSSIKRTLGGLIFEQNYKKNMLTIKKEK